MSLKEFVGETRKQPSYIFEAASFEQYVELPQLYDEIKVQNKELWKEKQELGPEWEDSLKENLMWNSINTNMLLVYTFRKYS